MLLSPENLKDFMIPIVESSSLFENKTVRLCIVANPCAGGFTRKKVSKKNFDQLEKIANNARNKAKVTSVEEARIFETSHPGEGSILVSELLQKLPRIIEEFSDNRDESQHPKGVANSCCNSRRRWYSSGSSNCYFEKIFRKSRTW